MEDEKACPRCGAALREGVNFCTSCGGRVAPAGEMLEEPVGGRGKGPAESAPSCTAVEGAGAAPVYPPPAPVGVGKAGMPPVSPSTRRSRAPILLGVLGGLLLVAGVVVLVLYLTLWRDGGGGTGNPVALARKYMEALEKKDVDAYMACFEEGFFSWEDNPVLEGMNLDPRRMLEMAFNFTDFSFKGVELELQREECDEATVVTTAGRMVVSVIGIEEEEDLAQNPLTFRMARKGGRWYLTEDPMPALGGGFNPLQQDMDMDMDEYDLEDLEEYLPEGWSLEDLENLRPEDVEELIRELMEEMEGPPRWEEPPDESVTWKGQESYGTAAFHG